MSSARTTVSMPAELYSRAVQRQQELGYASFSDYIQALIRADSLSGNAHIREPASPAVSSNPAGAPKKDTGDQILGIVKQHYPQRKKKAAHPKAQK